MPKAVLFIGTVVEEVTAVIYRLLTYTYYGGVGRVKKQQSCMGELLTMVVWWWWRRDIAAKKSFLESQTRETQRICKGAVVTRHYKFDTRHIHLVRPSCSSVVYDYPDNCHLG